MTSISYSDIQNGLSWTQAVPVLGPLLASPAKVLVSTAQIIAAVVGVIFGLALSVTIIFARPGINLLKTSWSMATDGVNHLTYSLANILTFGILGYRIENGIRA